MLRRNTLNTFDLRFPLDFAPHCTHGKLTFFECLPVTKLVHFVWCHASEVQFQSCLSFPMRQGFFLPNEVRYLKTLVKLYRAECCWAKSL